MQKPTEDQATDELVQELPGSDAELDEIEEELRASYRQIADLSRQLGDASLFVEIGGMSGRDSRLRDDGMPGRFTVIAVTPEGSRVSLELVRTPTASWCVREMVVEALDDDVDVQLAGLDSKTLRAWSSRGAELLAQALAEGNISASDLARTRRRPGRPGPDDAFLREVVRRRLAGETLREIASSMGSGKGHPGTTRRWLDQARGRQIDGAEKL